MKWQILILGLLFTSMIYSQSLDTIVYNGDEDEYINFVILGDGYTASEHASNKFKTDATNFVNAMLAESPFSEYANFFNFFIIIRNSVQSGADKPNVSTNYCGEFGDVITAYNSTFNTNGIFRLLSPQNEALAFTDLANLFPAFDQIIMIVNDPCYGGAGGTIATASTNVQSNDIAIHEMAHSFGFLADEYYAGDQFAIEAKPNITMDNNAGTNKWNDWIGQNGVGIYQHVCPFDDEFGVPSPDSCYIRPAFDEFDQWYKPHQNCKMQYLNANFCSVCKEVLIDSIYALVDPFVAKTPNLTSLFSFNGSSTTFGSELILPTINYTMEWELNGNVLSNRTNEFEAFNFEDFIFGGNVLKLRVIDETTMSKTYLPQSGYIFELSWIVNKVDLCSDYVNKFPFENSFPSGSDAGQTTGDDFDWAVNSGQTGSSGTGPSQAYHETTYLYAEATGQNPGDIAVYRTDCIDLRYMNSPRLSFALHMQGSAMGDLLVEVSTTAGNDNFGELLVKFGGEQGEDWKEHEFDLSPYVGPYTKLQFKAIRGPDYQSDIAIDYLRIYDACPDQIIIDNSNTAGGTFKAKYDITSTDLVTSTTTYRAGRNIKLNAGFGVDPGKVFTTQQGGCN